MNASQTKLTAYSSKLLIIHKQLHCSVDKHSAESQTLTVGVDFISSGLQQTTKTKDPVVKTSLVRVTEI